MSRPRKKLGMTIVELLITLTLATMLVVGMLGVVSGVARRHGELTNGFGDAWKIGLARQLEVDFLNARSLSFDAGSLSWEGYGSYGFDGRNDHRPGRITYSLQYVDDQTWLVRTEFGSTGQILANQLIVQDVIELDVQTFDAVRGQWQSEIWNKRQLKRMTVPDVLRIVLISKEGIAVDQVCQRNW